MRRAVSLAAAVLLLAFPAAGFAAGGTAPPQTGTPGATPGANPFGPLPESQPQQQTPTVATPSSSSSSSGSSLSSTQKTALVAGGALVLVLVGFFIWRDARRRAPVRHARIRAAAAPPDPVPAKPGARGLHTGRGKGGKSAKKRRR